MDDAGLQVLVEQVVAGADGAWEALWLELEPILKQQIAKPGFLGRLGMIDDERDNIALAVVERLRGNDHQRLRAFLDARARNPGMQFLTWLRIVAKRTGIDYMRAHPQYLDRRRAGASSLGKSIEHGTMPSSSKLPGARPPVTNQNAAAQLMRYAATELPVEQTRALEMWLHGESYDAIATVIACETGKEAEKQVRAAIERLRRKFRVELESP